MKPTTPGIFRDNYVSAVAADALATCVVSSSAVMLLNMRDIRLRLFHVCTEAFQEPVSSHSESRNIYEKCEYYFFISSIGNYILVVLQWWSSL